MTLARELLRQIADDPEAVAELRALVGGRESATPAWLSAADAAAYTGVSIDTLERAVRDGALSAAQPSGRRGRRLFERAELDRWLRGR